MISFGEAESILDTLCPDWREAICERVAIKMADGCSEENAIRQSVQEYLDYQTNHGDICSTCGHESTSVSKRKRNCDECIGVGR